MKEKKKKIVSEKFCLNAFEETVLENPPNPNYSQWTPFEIFSSYLEEIYCSSDEPLFPAEEIFVGTNLPSRERLEKLFMQTEEFKKFTRGLAEEMVCSFIAAFDNHQDYYLSMKDAKIKEIEQEKERLAAIVKLTESLSNEQRRELQKAFNISI